MDYNFLLKPSIGKSSLDVHDVRNSAKSGKPCRAAATAGGLCFFHANPNKASELGRIGGRSKRHADENLDPLPTLDNALGVQDALARLIAEVHAGKVHPRIAAVLAPLLNLQMRAIETTNLERRLARVEKLLADKDELNSTGGAPGADVIQHRKPPRKA